MKQEELFLTIEQCKHLQKLGLDMSDATFCWMNYDKPIISMVEDCKGTQSDNFIIPTYTLQEVLEKLPYGRTWDTWQWQITFNGKDMEYNDGDGYSLHSVYGMNILENAYNMLCWALEREKSIVENTK